MSKYTEEFRRNAIELMKKIGITKACKELKVSHCTIYRWCRELEGDAIVETEEPVSADLDAMIEEQVCSTETQDKESEKLAAPEADPPHESENDTVSTAMALLVIENTHLREVIKHLRDTISGLTDHRLL